MNQLKKIVVRLLYVIIGVWLSGLVFSTPHFWVEILIAAVVVIILFVWDE